MNRLTDKDRNWGPFTLAPWGMRIAVMFSSGDEEETPVAINTLLLQAFGWALRIRLPRIIQPHRTRYEANWDEATQKRLGRNHYFVTHEREYGAILCNMGNGYDFLQVRYGPQTGDSDTTKAWCKHLPWKQWDCVRHSIYTPDGEHFFTEERQKWEEFFAAKDRCPASHFLFDDYDGERITATCIIEEREWHRGEGRFKWLRFFCPGKIRRDLDLLFSSGVGPEKGSWKGGTIGHSIRMLPGETPEQAFKRYCAQTHERKCSKFHLTFISVTPSMNTTSTPDPTPSIVALEDHFTGALIGHTISHSAGPRYVYSLNALARIISGKLGKSLEHARKDVMDIVRDVGTMHGDNAPLFVDDAVSRPGIDKEKSRIVLPGTNGFRHPRI